MWTCNKNKLERFQYVENKSEKATRNVGRYSWKLKTYIYILFFLNKKILYLLAGQISGYPASRIFSRISGIGQIIIWFNTTNMLHLIILINDFVLIYFL